MEPRRIGAEIDGVHTDFLWFKCEDCLVLGVTQLGKFGNLIRAEKCERTGIYELEYLLGADSIETRLVARRFVERFVTDGPLYLFCSLRDYGVESIRAAEDVFADLLL